MGIRIFGFRGQVSSSFQTIRGTPYWTFLSCFGALRVFKIILCVRSRGSSSFLHSLPVSGTLWNSSYLPSHFEKFPRFTIYALNPSQYVLRFFPFRRFPRFTPNAPTPIKIPRFLPFRNPPLQTKELEEGGKKGTRSRLEHRCTSEFRVCGTCPTGRTGVSHCARQP